MGEKTKLMGVIRDRLDSVSRKVLLLGNREDQKRTLVATSLIKALTTLGQKAALVELSEENLLSKLKEIENLDYLFIDFMGGELSFLLKHIPELSGSIVVVSESRRAVLDLKRAISRCKEHTVALIGMIECATKEKRGASVAQQVDIPFLGSLFIKEIESEIVPIAKTLNRAMKVFQTEKIMDNRTNLSWETVDRQRVYNGKIFDLSMVTRRSTEGVSGQFVEVNAPLWATVIPWFRDEQGVPHFLMVQQFRHGSDSVTIEFPAGTVDEGETPKEAALRELLEETGCAPTGAVIELGSVSPNAAFMSNRVYFYFVEGVKRVDTQKLDTHEQLNILKLPVDHVIASMGTDSYDNGIMMIAQAYFLRYAEQRPELLKELS